MNYFLAPKSGEKSYRKNESTLKHGVPLESIDKFLTPKEREVLAGEDIIYAWGNRRGTKSAWTVMKPGDLVIFYAQKKLVMTGTVYLKIHNPQLALAMWPRDKNGKPWEYTFFIKDLRHIALPVEIFNPMVDYKVNNHIQKFTRLHDDKVARIISKYGSVEEMLDLFSDGNSTDIPTEKEKVYVNLPEVVNPLVIHDLPIRPYVKGEYQIKGNLNPGKTDHVARTKKNILTGSLGEEIVLKFEKDRLIGMGKKILAEKVTRVSLTDDSLGYDIRSYEETGDERLIEVKACTKANKKIQFFVSSNEFSVGTQNQNYYIYFVEDVYTASPRVSIFPNPMNDRRFNKEPDGYIFQAEKMK